MAVTLPRGLRNNNPGNIRKTGDRWQGVASSQPDPSFVTFETPVWGIRALARILIRYQDQHDLSTIRDIIERWAPVSDNNNTNAYIRDVVYRTGFADDQPLNLQTYEHLKPLVKAIIWHENGQQPYSEAQIDEGLKLAGVVKVETASAFMSAAKDPRVIATTVATSAAAAQATVSSVSGIWDDLSRYIDPRILLWACVAIAALIVVSFVIDKLRSKREGRS